MSEKQPMENNRFEELAGLLLDDEITSEDLSELAQLVKADAGLLEELRRQLITADQLEQYEDEQRAAELFVKGLEARISATAGSEQFVEQVLETVQCDSSKTESTKGKIMNISPIEPEASWLGSGKFWAIAASVFVLLALGLGLQSWNMANKQATVQEAILFGSKDLMPGAPAAFRVFVRDGASEEPVPEATVHVSLMDADGDEVWGAEAKTDTGGFVEVSGKIPEDASEGEYKLEVQAESVAGESSITRAVQLVRSFKVMVTTDKPLYQPGQTIHIRSLSLVNADLRPVAGRKTVIEVQDAKGNKVFKKVGETSGFGIFAADFQLADQVNHGSYIISATVGDTTSQRTVQVERYRLPKFKVSIDVDKGFYQPGDVVTGHITAMYTFGEPVSGGKIKLVVSEFIERFREFVIVEGEADEQGKFPFEIRLKNNFVGQELRQRDAFATLQAEVTDTADHAQKTSRTLTVTRRPIRIEVFPESGKLVQGVDNTVYILTAYPDGRPAKTTLTLAGQREKLQTSAAGIAKVKIHPEKPNLQLTISAEDAQGTRAREVRKLRVDERVKAFLLRTDRAVYQTGDTVEIEALSPSGKERLFIDVVKDGRAVLMKGIDVENGSGKLALDLPADLHGTLELRGYRIQHDGNIIGDTKVIQVRRADRLVIEAKLDKETYKPGEKALLDFVIKRADGKSVPAALGLAGVDEAVFALQEMRPGLERVYFAIQEEILKPRYEIHSHAHVDLPDILEPQVEPEPELEEATVVLFAAAEGEDAAPGEASPDFEEKKEIVRKEKETYFRKLGAFGVLSPVMLFTLLLLPLAGYAIMKFFRRQPLALTDDAAEDTRRATSHLLLWWMLGINVPFFGVVLAMLIGSITNSEALGFMFLGCSLFAVLTAVGFLVYAVIRVHRCEALAALPLLRKVLLPLPGAFLLAVCAIITVIIAFESRPRLVNSQTVAQAMLIVFGFLALTGGALSIARQSLLRQLSIGRMVWLGVSRSCLAGLPLILSGIFLLNGPAMAKMEMGDAMAMPMDAAGGMDFAVGEEMGMPEVNRAVEEDGITDDAGAEEGDVGGAGDGKLKEPTRVRRYFPETLLWKPELITDEQGRAKLEVPLADSITTWRLAMSAVSQQGELGSATTGIRVFQDFFVDIDFPVALTQHDQVSVPVAVYNYLDKPQTVQLEVQEGAWFGLMGEAKQTLELKAREVKGVSFRLEALKPGTHALTVKASGSEMADAVQRQVRVEPDGRRMEQVLNGRLDENLNRRLEIPADAIEGANDLFVKIYPGAFSQVLEGMENIFQMPYGCFEQTSSATYPNILVLDYLRRNKMAKPETELKALNYINVGYQRLLSYEVKGGGFEWFGKAPAHNVLTAYGLMEFSDMAKVYDVDPKVIERTRRWLLGRQQRDGSWKPDQGGIAEGAINAFQGATLRTTAYMAWALAESGETSNKLDKAFDYIIRRSDGEDDNYTLALCANAFAAAKRDEARDFINRLLAAKQEEKEFMYWTSKGQGLTHGRGNTLAIETTALVAQAFLKTRQHTAVAHKALAWLIDRKDGRGTWYSTQATVHAMRALLGGTGAGGGVDKPLSISIIANGKPAKELKITPETSDVFRLISLRHLVKTGENTVALEPNGKGNLAFQIVAVHYEPWAQVEVPQEQELTIDVDYDTTTLKADDVLTCKVTVEYHRPGTADMTIVDLGIPPGFEVKPEFFQAMKEEDMIERYSITGRQVILYFREIRSKQPVEFTYELKAKFPVKAKAPKSVAYQYYEPEIRAEARPFELVVLQNRPTASGDE